MSRRVLRSAFGALKARVDWPVAARFPVRRPDDGISIYVIERAANADNVDRLAPQADKSYRWDLATRPGEKFDLLHQLILAHPPEENEWIVIADDDVVLSRGDLRRFVAISARLGFDLAQPAHDRRGFVNYGLTVSRIGVRARQTTFVEIG